MKLKKPAKDHRGEWDLVLDNNGHTVASLRVRDPGVPPMIVWLWPIPSCEWDSDPADWETHYLHVASSLRFLDLLGVDTAPLEALRKEQGYADIRTTDS